MVKPFQILGPTNNPYPGTVCLTQLPLPVGANVKAGDLATIQIVETAQHGAALYSVSQRCSLMQDAFANVYCHVTVRRHRICRTGRPPHSSGKRNKLLQLHRYWFCRHLYHYLQGKWHRQVQRRGLAGRLAMGYGSFATVGRWCFARYIVEWAGVQQRAGLWKDKYKFLYHEVI